MQFFETKLNKLSLIVKSVDINAVRHIKFKFNEPLSVNTSRVT